MSTPAFGQTDRAYYNYNASVDNPQDESRYFQRRLDDVVPATVPVGTGDGQVLFWDAVALSWTLSNNANLKWEDATSVLLVSTLNLLNALTVPYGGTGATTLTDHGILLGSGTGAVTPTAVGATGTVLAGNTGADPTFKTPTVIVPLVLSMYDAEPARATEDQWNGGMEVLATGQPLDSVPTNIVVSKGIGKVLIVVNAGTDLAGEITVTGESIDRTTGASTPGDTDTITVDAVTTDNSTTDSNGNVVHGFTGAYITSKWFTGTVTLSTADLTLTDVDVYHVSFEQFNDQANITLNSFDANIYTTNVAAEFDAYLYDLQVTGDKCNITKDAELHVGADGETAIANRHWRLRKGNINTVIDGSTDGIWVDIHYANSPAYVEDVTMKVWAQQTTAVDLN